MSTAKTLLSVLSFFLVTITFGQTYVKEPQFIAQIKEACPKIDLASASVRINNKAVSYAAMLQVPDSALLKAEVYSKMLASKVFGKEEGKTGIVNITLRKGEMFQADMSRKTNYIYNDKGDTFFCKQITIATIEGDTTRNNWNKFLVKNLKANVPIENECPPGIYNVDFSFLITKEGAVTSVKTFQDPGYGCAAEVKRMMLQSPKWVPGSCEQTPVNYLLRQRITFMVSE